MKRLVGPLLIKQNEWMNLNILGGPKNDGEKWSTKNMFEISPCGSHYLSIHFTS